MQHQDLLCLRPTAGDLVLKLVGGAFDGANSMMGSKGGVQKLLKDYSPFAIFVHCVCHRAALLARDAVSDSDDAIGVLHDALAKIYAIFSRSGTRIEDLHQFQEEFMEPNLNPVSIAATRWLSSEHACTQLNRIAKSMLSKVRNNCIFNLSRQSPPPCAIIICSQLDLMKLTATTAPLMQIDPRSGQDIAPGPAPKYTVK